MGGDLGAALQQLGLAATDPRARSLITFALSEPCLSLRVQVGLALGARS
jgi:hypothetical protein